MFPVELAPDSVGLRGAVQERRADHGGRLQSAQGQRQRHHEGKLDKFH